SLRNSTREVRAFLIGRAVWKRETFPGVFSSSPEQAFTCSDPLSRGLALILTYKVGIHYRRGTRSSARRGSCLLFKRTIDTARTDSDKLGNLHFVVSFPIQLPDPLM